MTIIVNGEKIEDSAIQQEFERLRPHYEQAFKDQDPKQQKAQLLDWSKENVIEMALIKQDAKKHGDPIPEDIVESALAKIKEQYADQEQFYKDFDAKDDGKIKEVIKMQMRVERRLEDVCKDLTEPSQEAISQYYDQNKEQLKSPEQIRVGHIVKHISWQADEEAAQNVIRKAQDELKKGAVFETLAQKYSDCPENGGDLGYITRGQMVEEFEDVVFNLDIGRTSNVFRTRFGFHIAKVYDRKPPVLPDLKEVKDHIVDALKEKMKSKAIDNFLDKLKSKAKIEET
ncbi:MAG TPA: peptidylprolyl isomerase [Sedimentisphaerales bacterium]|nr:peptidylprolyl isomerase [Sedimentisphaerales bacterium]